MVKTSEIPQCSRLCSRLFATPSWCYPLGRDRSGWERPMSRQNDQVCLVGSPMLGITRREFITLLAALRLGRSRRGAATGAARDRFP
jgi:hypothetical protein